MEKDGLAASGGKDEEEERVKKRGSEGKKGLRKKDEEMHKHQ